MEFPGLAENHERAIPSNSTLHSSNLPQQRGTAALLNFIDIAILILVDLFSFRSTPSLAPKIPNLIFLFGDFHVRQSRLELLWSAAVLPPLSHRQRGYKPLCAYCGQRQAP